MNEIKSFKDLKIWQISIEIVKTLYSVIQKFPKAEMFGLTSQIKRSSISVPSNIAEGFKRHHTKEYKQFLRIALGSLAELETQVIIARELQFLNLNECDEITQKIHLVSKMTSGLLRKLPE